MSLVFDPGTGQMKPDGDLVNLVLVFFYVLERSLDEMWSTFGDLLSFKKSCPRRQFFRKATRLAKNNWKLITGN